MCFHTTSSFSGPPLGRCLVKETGHRAQRQVVRGQLLVPHPGLLPWHHEGTGDVVGVEGEGTHYPVTDGALVAVCNRVLLGKG